MLSVAAKLYLTWQVFDAVNRRPLRFPDLEEAVPELAAWPEWRQALRNDQRFLVQEDLVDIATVALHSSAPVEQIILATLDRARLPMRDHDMMRIIRRLRPDLPDDADPIGEALAVTDLFRPRAFHVGRRNWLKGAEPLELPADLPDSPVAAAVRFLERRGERVPAVPLAAALAERFDLSILEAYAAVVDPQLLPLPDGTVYLYDAVADELWRAATMGDPASPGGDDESDEATGAVAVSGLEESVPIPPDLADRVARLARERNVGVTTSEVVIRLFQVEPEEPRYLSTYWQVNRHLELSGACRVHQHENSRQYLPLLRRIMGLQEPYVAPVPHSSLAASGLIQLRSSLPTGTRAGSCFSKIARNVFSSQARLST